MPTTSQDPGDLVSFAGSIVRRGTADRLQAEMDAALATLPPGGLRIGTRYNFKTKAWTIGAGRTLDELSRPFSMGCRTALGDLEIIAPTTP